MNTPIMKLATNSCNTIELLLKDKENNKALYDKLVLENEKLKETAKIFGRKAYEDQIELVKKVVDMEKKMGTYKPHFYKDIRFNLEVLNKENKELKEENERIKDCFEICSNKSMCTIEELEDAISVLQRTILSYFNLSSLDLDLEDVLDFCRNKLDE